MEGVVRWPPEFAHRYRARGYWAGETIGQAFDRSVAAHAGRVAVVDGERRLTYRELSRLVDRLALHLAARDVRGGAVVVFQLPNVLEFVVAYLACLKVGAIPLCCRPAHRHAEIGDLARFTAARAWLLPSTFRGFDHVAMAGELRGELPALREVLVAGERAGRGMTLLGDLLADPVEERIAPGSLGRLRPRPDDVAVFHLSRGTTGPPRVVPRTHDDYLYASRASAAATGVGGDTVLLVTVPASHNFPLACPGIPATLLLGGRVVLAPSAEAETVFRLIEAERVTWVPAVPAHVVAWMNDPGLARADLSSLRTLCVSGSRLDPGPARRVLREIGPVLTQGFGMAEGLLCYTRRGDPEEVVVETQGRPVSPDDEVRIVDEREREVPPGEVGELLCRGPYTIRGYYRAPERDAATFTPDGFYRTGALVRRHPSGNLVVEGRREGRANPTTPPTFSEHRGAGIPGPGS